MQNVPKLRIARSTDHLEEVVRFYQDGLGLSELHRFYNHEGFDGVMLGSANAEYHLEFTLAHGYVAGRAPTPDNLLVFYLPDEREWREAVARMKRAGYYPVTPFNPYWDRCGVTFEDPDGYRIVLQNAKWE